MGIPLPPPWVMLSLALGLSKHVQDLKDISSLGWTIIRGQGDGAGCGLCDKLVSVVLRHADGPFQQVQGVRRAQIRGLQTAWMEMYACGGLRVHCMRK